jgi:lysyl-tRNA synthetase class 2
MDIELLRFRAAAFREIRRFFDERPYLEVDTPLLAPDLIPESCLEVFETRRLPPDYAERGAEPCWLVPSPEIWMKKLVASHRQSLYQICKCFRNGESSGRFHSPEFTMLEFYTMDTDYRDSLTITENLFSSLLSRLCATEGFGEETALLRPPFQRISMGEAFGRWAGFDLYEAAASPGGLETEARRLGLEPPPGLDAGALYDLVFIHAVEPKLPKNRPLAIVDYPAFVPCLAKKSADRKTVERWELYVQGIELANCYTEETNPEEVRRFFATETAAKQKNAQTPHRVDEDYWKVFLPRRDSKDRERPFPRCSGVAMGLDRLIMALSGRSSIDGTLPFPMG